MNDSYLLWGLGLLGASLLLVFIEVLVPSAGIITLIAATLAIAGVICLFQVSVLWGFAGLLAVLILGPIIAFFALNILPNTPMGRRLINAAPPPDPANPPTGPDPALAHLLGQEAETLTALRPVGAIRVDGHRYDALAELGIIEPGKRVRVIAVDGNTIKVREVV